MKAFHEVRTYDSDFMVWHSSYEDISFLAHWHQEIELIYLRSGSAHLSINDHTFTAHQGDLVVIDTGDFHYSDSSQMKNTLDFIIFDPSIISSIYHHTHFEHPLVTAGMLKTYGLDEELAALTRRFPGAGPKTALLSGHRQGLPPAVLVPAKAYAPQKQRRDAEPEPAGNHAL